MKGRIFIEALALETFIGLHAWEKTARQTVIADIEIGIDYSQAADSDDISNSVNYETLANQLRAWAYTNRCELLEKLASNIIQQIGRPHPCVHFVEIKLAKHGVVPHTKSCGVTLRVDYHDA